MIPLQRRIFHFRAADRVSVSVKLHHPGERVHSEVPFAAAQLPTDRN